NSHIVCPYAEPIFRWTEAEADWNARMSAVSIEVEHGFGGIVTMWPHKLWASPIGRYYRIAVLLTHNCLRPSQTAQYFQCEPPILEECFH
ncbi:hypothetical protein DFH07DRAFT_682545, partial [Mycena maculata]